MNHFWNPLEIQNKIPSPTSDNIICDIKPNSIWVYIYIHLDIDKNVEPHIRNTLGIYYDKWNTINRSIDVATSARCDHQMKCYILKYNDFMNPRHRSCCGQTQVNRNVIGLMSGLVVDLKRTIWSDRSTMDWEMAAVNGRWSPVRSMRVSNLFLFFSIWLQIILIYASCCIFSELLQIHSFVAKLPASVPSSAQQMLSKINSDCMRMVETIDKSQADFTLGKAISSLCK